MQAYDESIRIDVDTSMMLLVKMCFVYSAIMDGWKVEKLSDNKICFSKKNIKKHFSIDSFIKKHLPSNLNIPTISCFSNN